VDEIELPNSFPTLPPHLASHKGRLKLGQLLKFELADSPANDPDHFLVTIDDFNEASELLTEYLAEAESFPPVFTVDVDVKYIVKFSEDDQWYRAKVVSKSLVELKDQPGAYQEAAVMRFYDWGNEEEMIVSKDRIRQMPDDLGLIPSFLFQCSLHHLYPLTGAWDVTAKEAFVDLIFENQEILRLRPLKQSVVKEGFSLEVKVEKVDDPDYISNVLIQQGKATTCKTSKLNV